MAPGSRLGFSSKEHFSASSVYASVSRAKAAELPVALHSSKEVCFKVCGKGYIRAPDARGAKRAYADAVALTAYADSAGLDNS